MGKIDIRDLRRASLSSLVIGLGVLGFTGVAQSSILLPGQALPPTGVVTLSGSVVADTGSVPFIGLNAFNVPVFTGSVDTKVISDIGGLDFVYQFSDDSGSVDSIQRLTAGGYSGYTTDADYISGTGAAAPFLVSRSTNGDVIGFSFLSSAAVGPGQHSDILFIKTDATNFAPSAVSFSDGGTGSASSFAPVTVPEPASLAVVAMGFGAMAMRRRKSRA